MINNRQAGRRNRGRNNGRQNGGNRGGDSGNRIDSRARGNAPQLLEKYRNMARDAQLAGDRVNTEYYLQFADHYFRVIADNRARQEEQQSRVRRNDESLDEQDDSFDALPDMRYGARSDSAADEQDEQAAAPAETEERRPRNERRQRPLRVEVTHHGERAAGDGNDAGEGLSEGAEEGDEAAPKRTARARKPRQPRKARDDSASAEDGAAPGFDLAALPPAIARADNDGEDNGGDDDGEAAPRRRIRRTRASAEAAE